MTPNKNFDFAKLRAEHFGQWLDEAFQTMLDFSLENKFDCYPPEDHRELESVLEFLMIVTDMWTNGQIMVSSQEEVSMKRNRLQEAEMAVLAILKKGRANATTGGEIATITGYNSRLISSAISNLVIRYGVPIIGARVGIRNGYYIAETREELLEGLVSLKNQVKNEQKRLDVLMSIEDVNNYEKILERS